MGYGSSSRNGVRPIWVVLHTAEGARTRQDLAKFFDNNPNASSHVGIDAGGIVDMIPRDRAAWTLGSGNPLSINGEMCGFAKWTREQWLSTDTVDGCVNPRQIIRSAAAWVRRECDAIGIPKVVLNIADCGAGKAGVIDHNTFNKAYRAGSHWDVGSGFPWDVFYADLVGEDWLDMASKDEVKQAVREGVLDALKEWNWDVRYDGSNRIDLERQDNWNLSDIKTNGDKTNELLAQLLAKLTTK